MSISMQSLVQAYIDELARTLMEGAEQPDTPAHARMVQLTNANVIGLPSSDCMFCQAMSCMRTFLSGAWM